MAQKLLFTLGLFIALSASSYAQKSFGSSSVAKPAPKMEAQFTGNYSVSSGFDVMELYEVHGKKYVFCHNIESGVSEIFRASQMNSPIDQRKTHAGWTDFVFFNYEAQPYMFEYKSSTGHYQFYRVKADGSLGKKVSEKKKWSKNWTDFELTYQGSEPIIYMSNPNGRIKTFRVNF